MAATVPSRRQKRRELRRATKRRVRGGEHLAPVAVQRVARRVDDVAFVGQQGLRKAMRGDRPFVLGFVALLLLGVAVLSGPLRDYMDQRDRVELLEQQVAVLDGANAALEQRRDDLRDPVHLRLEARERLGYVEPGEVPYVIVPPERDPQTITEPLHVPEIEAAPWYRRVWNTLTGWFG